MNYRFATTILMLIIVATCAVAVWRHEHHPKPDPGIPNNVVLAGAIPSEVVGAAIQSRDINATPIGRTSIMLPGRDYDISGGGADIGGSDADGFRFVWIPMTGNFDVRVQIAKLAQVVPGTRAGLMVRDGVEPGSRMVFCGATAADGYRFNYRTAANGAGTYLKAGAVTFPNGWVRLKREGDQFSGFTSVNGSDWTASQGSVLPLRLPAEVKVGMAVCSHDVTSIAAGEFRNLIVIGKMSSPGGIIPQRKTSETQPETRP